MLRVLPPALAALAHLVIAAAPASSQTFGDIHLPPRQEAAARQLAQRLVDGDVNRQVLTADYAARLCYRAAMSNASNGAGRPDRDRLTPARRAQFVDCIGQSGYRLRGG